MGGQKRRLRQRVKEVGEEVEESIRQAGEEQKLQHVAADQLFQVDSKGGDAPRLSKRQKLQIKDPLVKSRKFDATKASRFEVERLKKLKAAQEAAAAAKPVKTQRKAESKQPALPWGQEEQPDADDYVAPALTAHQPAKRRKKVAASTRHRVAKVEVPAAGQSYHPDFEAHQDVMASAVAEELERRELRAKMAEPVRAGLSEETLQFINDKDSVRCLERTCRFLGREMLTCARCDDRRTSRRTSRTKMTAPSPPRFAGARAELPSCSPVADASCVNAVPCRRPSSRSRSRAVSATSARATSRWSWSTRRAARRRPSSSRSTRACASVIDAFSHATTLTARLFPCQQRPPHRPRGGARREGVGEEAGTQEAARGAEAERGAARARRRQAHVRTRTWLAPRILRAALVSRCFGLPNHSKLERETPVLFSEELTGNMRTLRPKGHPLLDRFDSLHKRNMIEIGGPRKTRKRKVRIIEVKK